MMNDSSVPSRNNQLTFLAIAILIAGVLIAGAVLFKPRSTEPRSTDPSVQQLIQQQGVITHRLDQLEQRLSGQDLPTPAPIGGGSMPSTPGTSVSSPPSPAIDIAPGREMSKSIYEDKKGRFSFLVGYSCTAQGKDSVSDMVTPVLPREYIAIILPGYGEWMSYQVVTKAQLDSFLEDADPQAGPNNRWKLSDGTYLISFGPQDLPDAALNCSVSVNVK